MTFSSGAGHDFIAAETINVKNATFKGCVLHRRSHTTTGNETDATQLEISLSSQDIIYLKFNSEP